MSDTYQIKSFSSQCRYLAIKLTRKFWEDVDIYRDYSIFTMRPNGIFEPMNKDKFWSFVDENVNTQMAKKISEFLIKGDMDELDIRSETLDWIIEKNKIQGYDLYSKAKPHIEKVIEHFYKQAGLKKFKKSLIDTLNSFKSKDLLDREIDLFLLDLESIQECEDILNKIKQGECVIQISQRAKDQYNSDNMKLVSDKLINQKISKKINTIISNRDMKIKEYIKTNELDKISFLKYNHNIITKGLWQEIEKDLDKIFEKANNIIEATKHNSVDHIEVISGDYNNGEEENTIDYNHILTRRQKIK